MISQGSLAHPAPLAKRQGQMALKNSQAMQSTIPADTLNAFKEMTMANVDKVILGFGIKVAGEGGVPYITKAEVNAISRSQWNVLLLIRVIEVVIDFKDKPLIWDGRIFRV